MKVLVPLAEGFEEIEAVTIIDILRRAGIETVTAALKNNPVKGAHNIFVTADTFLDEVISREEITAIILPGGMPGSTNLKNDSGIINLVQTINKSGGLTAAICAAPIILGESGVLKGKKFTCYPGYEKEIHGAVYVKDKVVSDGTVITSMGPGCAPLFALAVVEYLKDSKTAESVKKQLIAFW